MSAPSGWQERGQTTITAAPTAPDAMGVRTVASFMRRDERDRAVACVNLCAGVDSATLERIAQAGGLKALLADATENASIYHRGNHDARVPFEACAATTCCDSRRLLGLGR